MDLLTERLPWVRDTTKWPRPFKSRGVSYAGDGFVVAKVGKEYVDLPSHRYSLPRRLEALFDRPDLPGCQLAIVVGQGGPVCGRLVLAQRPDEEPLTASQLRRVPLAELVKEVVTLVGAYNIETGNYDREGFAKELAAMPSVGKGKRLSDDHLALVAEVYRDAVKLGRSATDAVKERFNPISRSTAGRWVVEARRRGLLGPARTGLAGELEQEGGNDG